MACTKHISRLLRLLLLVLACACKQSYEPPQITAPNSFLVIDGFINASPNAVTSFTLSRSRNLVDTVGMLAEANATVIVESNTGQRFALQYQGGGVYSNLLPVNNSAQYRLTIQTQNGSNYVSDFVPVKLTPPIDSVTWQQDGDVNIFVNTHDPQNQTRYYRWDFIETYQYQSELNTILGLQGNMIYYRDATEQTYVCWRSVNSTQIVTGSSVKLSNDVVDHVQVASVPENSKKIALRYSILVNQYALTQQAYNYWEIMKKNTQELGTLFDPQPSQLVGNVKCISNPAEPIIGYVSASGVQSKRIFINNNEVNNWTPAPDGFNCDVKLIPQNANFALYNYPDTSFAPYYYVSGGGLSIAKKYCLDCKLQGGTNIQPSFW